MVMYSILCRLPFPTVSLFPTTDVSGDVLGNGENTAQTIENHTGPEFGVMDRSVISFHIRTHLVLIPWTVTAQFYDCAILRPVMLPFLFVALWT